MPELKFVKARTIVVNDKHRHIINLAMVLAKCSDRLRDELNRLPFHPDVLSAAQEHCIWWESQPRFGESPNFEAAKSYAIAVWMGRSSKAGTKDEFKGKLALRWNAGGGDSNVRFRSAADSLESFGEIMQRCTFSVLDFRPFLAKCKDAPRHGIYSDSPFPDAGDEYKHSFSEQDHCDLAAILSAYRQTRVVCRFYDHPLIRHLYPTPIWEWTDLEGRKQTNASAPEVLIVNAA